MKAETGGMEEVYSSFPEGYRLYPLWGSLTYLACIIFAILVLEGHLSVEGWMFILIVLVLIYTTVYFWSTYTYVRKYSIAIYKDGMGLDFRTPRKDPLDLHAYAGRRSPRQRYVPLSAIEGIYPFCIGEGKSKRYAIRFIARYKDKRGRGTTLVGQVWQDKRNDLREIIRALKEVLGEDWKNLFRPGEPIAPDREEWARYWREQLL